MHRIFVYGTLKRGWELAHLLETQRFLGAVRTVPRYRMIHLGSYPGLIEVDNGEGFAIEGELWEISGACLAELDEVEGVDEREYERRSIELDTRPPPGETGPIVQAYFYLGDVDGRPDCGPVW